MPSALPVTRVVQGHQPGRRVRRLAGKPGPGPGGDSARRRSRTCVRLAAPAAWMQAASTVIRMIARASSPESAGQATSASATVVPARARPVLTASAASAFTSSAAFSAATTPSPHRVVIFSRAVGLRHPGPERDPAEPGPGDRAGHLPAQRLAAQPAAVLQEHHPQAGPDRDRRPPDSAGKCAAYGAKNTGSSSSASTRASPAGSCWYSGGRKVSHRLCCRFPVTSTGPIPLHPQGLPAMISSFGPSQREAHRRFRR